MGAKTKFRQIAGRLNGISCPVFGVSWDPPTLDVDVAHRVIVFLEDRRVLYEPAEVEVADHCVESVLEIRRFLTETIGAGGIAEDLAGHLRAMRGACRHFLTSSRVIGPDDDPELWTPWQRDRGHYRSGLDDWTLNQALGELRGVCGIHIAQIAVKYGIDLEEQLVSILPSPDEQAQA